jgi:regulator of cell morphogenesis and NO signaling
MSRSTPLDALAAAWTTVPLPDLIDHLQQHDHAALRRDLPPLLAAAERIENSHPDDPAVPAGLAAHLGRFWREIQIHMHKEETILFPLIRRGTRGPAVYMPIRAMEHEHDEAGHSLARIRELTGDLQPPANACRTWTALYRGLAAIEDQLRQHIHLENQVLFLRAARPG